MGRLSDSILGSNVAMARGVTGVMLNPLRGGQMGYAPNYTEWVNNQQYIRKNLIPILLEAPTGFQYLPNPEMWIGTLRAIIELHAQRITGLSATLEVETASTPFGGSGQQQEDPTNVTESQSQVTIELNEKYGMPFARFFDGWIRHLVMDPYSKYATINTLTTGPRVPDMLADRYSMTCLFIEPDPSHTTVVKAWLGTGMFPKSGVEITGSRDLTAAGEQMNYSISFTGIYQYGLGVNQFAQKILDNISITDASPYTMAAFIDGISADVAATSVGYTSSVANTANDEIDL